MSDIPMRVAKPVLLVDAQINATGVGFDFFLVRVLVLSVISAILTPEKVFPRTLRSKRG